MIYFTHQYGYLTEKEHCVFTDLQNSNLINMMKCKKKKLDMYVVNDFRSKDTYMIVYINTPRFTYVQQIHPGLMWLDIHYIYL